MRIFLDANILFSAAKSDGAIRLLLNFLSASVHIVVADQFVETEARRNLPAKADQAAADMLQALLAGMEVSNVQFPVSARTALEWLPAKDRPVLGAAIALRCDVLVTGDRTHFGPGHGQVFDGVTIYSPAQLAHALRVPTPPGRGIGGGRR